MLSKPFECSAKGCLKNNCLEYLRQEKYRQKSDVIRLTMSRKELAQRLGIPGSSLDHHLENLAGAAARFQLPLLFCI